MNISPKKLAANRANAAKSTGPRTTEGKSRSRLNSLKHGFSAAHFAIIRIEDPKAIDNTLADLVARYQPMDSVELHALQRIAIGMQMLARSAALEAGLFSAGLDLATETPGHFFLLLNSDLTTNLDVKPGQNHSFYLAEGFNRLVAKHHGDSWTLFLRYQSQADRLYRRALEDFDRLRAERPTLPEPLPEVPPIEPTAEPAAPSAEPEKEPEEVSQSPVTTPDPKAGATTRSPKAKLPIQKDS